MKHFVISNKVTKRTDAVEKYFNDIRKYKPLGKYEELELFRKGHKETVIKHNLAFVVSVANSFAAVGVPLPDLISVGNIGLVKAAENFDPERNVKFIFHAVFRIRQYIYEYLKYDRLIRLPHDMCEAQKRFATLSDEYLETVEDEELSKLLNLHPHQLKELKQLKRVVSIDAPQTTDEDSDSLEIAGDIDTDQHISKDYGRQVIEIAQSRLSGLEYDIVDMRLGLSVGYPQTFLEIGRKHKYTAERTRQIYETALRKLKSPLRCC